MRDLLDLYIGKFNQTAQASYYAKMPNNHTDNGITFDYEYVDRTAYRYQKLFSNVTVNNAASTSIKTRDSLDYKINGYVVLNDGKMYVISAVMKDYSPVSKQAFRGLGAVAGCEYVLDLIEKGNPWGLK